MPLSLPDAVRALNAGGIIIYPTETFFGIGCRADSEEALLRVFQIKRRPLGKPLPLILGSQTQLALAVSVPDALAGDVEDLVRFWPGPLTLLLPAKDGLPAPLTAGTGVIAVRMSPHPVAQALAKQCGFPVVSTSANVSERPPVTSAAALDPDLLAALDPRRDGVIDLPPAPSGAQASTIVRPLGGRRLELCRKGAFSALRLRETGFTLSC
ncbi:L-threonylcarbamoyladenylate synthase [uncultured Mailhella sp.]|uniref:L-threonylcarbamoyladenylate synthase n=1 Tax=uncultured Mailhella sp. TaxID=1981031 RepID=UPI0026382950|nr:L-threonylcarbamoyladenylate synthase [uncultured Mailhella sp.]